MKTVKCIDVSDGGNLCLEIGQVYEVEDEYTIGSISHYRFRGSPLGWRQSRFVTVLDNNLPAPHPGCPAPLGKRYAPDEECPCGLRAAQCTYHKGS
jgi:hypothetical protein